MFMLNKSDSNHTKDCYGSYIYHIFDYFTAERRTSFCFPALNIVYPCDDDWQLLILSTNHDITMESKYLAMLSDKLY